MLNENEGRMETKDVKSDAEPTTASRESTTHSKLLAWCSGSRNTVNIINLETKEDYAEFTGAQLRKWDYNSAFVKELQNTSLIVSLHHSQYSSAQLEIFDISQKGKARKIYTYDFFGRISYGDITYNPRRKFLGAIPVEGKTAYQLFSIDYNASGSTYSVKLLRKTNWFPEHGDFEDCCITGFDFAPLGDSVATINPHGNCVISDMNTGKCLFNLSMGWEFDFRSRCRWSSNVGEPLLFAKFDCIQLNILDTEKNTLTLKEPVGLDTWHTHWIDVCQSNGNLLASCGEDNNIKIYDRRESKIVTAYGGICSSIINCVRWNSSGDMLASASEDGIMKLIDVKIGKSIYTRNPPEEYPMKSVCFI